MDMGAKIYNLRTQKGLTLEQLGNLTGVGKSTVRKWENGMIANMRRDKILKLSRALGTTPSYLMGWDEKPEPETAGQSHAETVRADVPVKEDNSVCRHLAGTDISADFCLTVTDDSMANARILNGDIVFVRRQDTVKNGEIAVLTIAGRTQAVLKRFYYYKERNILILKSDNPACEDLFFQHEELKKVTILGKAVAFQSLIDPSEHM